MRKLFTSKYMRYTLLMGTGILIGWLFFHSSEIKESGSGIPIEVAEGTIWTCSMHPHIQMAEPGRCPICGMELIPLIKSGTLSIDPDALHLTAEESQLANVSTSVVSKQNPVKEVRLYGKVQIDERLLQSQVAHISGRIEELNVNFTGESVTKGQTLARIYSPELIIAQNELIEASKTKLTQPAIYEASRERLSQLKLTVSQIMTIEATGLAQNYVEVVANTNGIVTGRRINTGDYVSQGTVLFDIADLSQMWVMFDAYESDLQYLKKGNKISFTLQSMPGDKFTGNIAFIDPTLDPATRVSKVRVETENRSGRLKPEMFATGIAYSSLNEYNGSFVIPQSAVLWTGKRSVVYVKVPDKEEPMYKIREIELGPMLGDSYVVMDGLTEGEEIVTSGAFSVDAASQLEGKPSMMNTGINGSN